MTDALGLGDVVFPAMAAGWARRFETQAEDADDDAEQVGGKLPYKEGNKEGDQEGDQGGEGELLGACVAGYALGCVALELAPPQLATDAALPFLVPTTLALLVAALARSGRLGEAFSSPRG